MRREWHDVTVTGAPLLGYLLPTHLHPLGAVLPSPYTGSGYQGIEQYLVTEDGSYLGIVTIGLLVYALIRRPRDQGGSIWWGMLVLSVRPSDGDRRNDRRPAAAPLPSGWLWWLLPPFRLIRCTARFNLLAAGAAAYLASAGLAEPVR